MILPVGKVTISSAGTPVSAAGGLTNTLVAQKLKCHAFMVQAHFGNTGKIYVGVKGMNKATLFGVCAVLPIPTANIIASFSATLAYAPAPFDLTNIFVDADNSNDAVIVSAIVG